MIEILEKLLHLKTTEQQKKPSEKINKQITEIKNTLKQLKKDTILYSKPTKQQLILDKQELIEVSQDTSIN